ncbi:telomere recombination protein, partial [Helicosporidium sp. ATCC 50920]
YLCVVNTHLFFRDDASHVRSLHVWSALNAAQRVLQSLFPAPEPGACSEVPLLFCGDLNSDLNDGLPGAIKLLGSGFLERDYWDWASAVHFAYSAKYGPDKDSLLAEEAVEEEAHALQTLSDLGHASDSSLPPSPRAAGKPLRNPSAGHVAILRRHHGPELRSAPPLLPVDGLATPTTNYVPGYSGLLDYCFVDPRSFEVVRCYPPPSPAELGGFLPSEGHPSDHISVVADLRWKEPGRRGKALEEGSRASLHPTWGYLPHPPAAPGQVFPAELCSVHAAAHCLGQGQIVVLPTDTLYGLGCDARSEEAFQSLCAVKQRPQDKPISLAVADLADVSRVADVSHLPAGLLEALLPGPTTLILPFLDSAHVSPSVRAIALERGVGVRVPDAPFARAVARQLGAPLALTSANLAGEPSCVLVREFEHLWPRCGAVFDAGRAVCEERLGSTVLDLQVPGSFRVVRRGVGAEETLRRISREFGLREDAA